MGFSIASTVVDVNMPLDGIKKGMAGLKAAGASLGATLGTAFAPLTALVGGALVLKELIQGVKDAQHADNALNAVLKQQGLAVDENNKKFSEFALAMRKQTTYSDDAIKELVATGLQLGVPADKVKEFSANAVGLAKALGIDAQTAMTLLAKEAQGVPSALDRSIPALNGVTDAAARLKIISEQSALGLAMEMDATKGIEGSMKQLWEVLGDVGDILGGPLSAAITFAAEQLKSFAGWVSSTWELIQEFGFRSPEMFGGVGSALEAMKGVFAVVWDVLKAGINELIFRLVNMDLTFKQIGVYGKNAFGIIAGALDWYIQQQINNVSWILDNWKEIFQTIWSFTKNVFINLATNAANFGTAVWNALTGKDWDLAWTPLMDGFKNTIKELPKVANIKDFLPDMSKELDPIYAEMDKRRAEFAEANKKQAEKDKKNSEKIMSEPITKLAQADKRESDAKAKEQAQAGKGNKAEGSGGQSTGILEAYKALQSSALKGAEKKAQETLQTAKDTLQVQKEIKELLAKSKSGNAMAMVM